MPTAKLSDILDDRPRQSIHLVSQKPIHAGVSETKDNDTRRITGSADIPLTAEGKKESKTLANSLSEKFNWVLTSPEKRAMQTAKEFGKAIPLAGLDAWKRGAHEGKPVKAIEPAIRFLMLHPDKRPPGVSSISKEPGESLNEFARPLLGTVQAVLAVMNADDRGLIVSHGGNLQTVDAWLKAGKPEDLSFDHHAMAQKPYWSVVGELFKIGDNGLEKVKDNKEADLYFTEHGSTDFNSKK